MGYLIIDIYNDIISSVASHDFKIKLQWTASVTLFNNLVGVMFAFRKLVMIPRQWRLPTSSLAAATPSDSGRLVPPKALSAT
jgi:hypothetical protein